MRAAPSAVQYHSWEALIATMGRLAVAQFSEALGCGSVPATPYQNPPSDGFKLPTRVGLGCGALTSVAAVLGGLWGSSKSHCDLVIFEEPL